MADSARGSTVLLIITSIVIIIVLATVLSKLQTSNNLDIPTEQVDASPATADEPLTVSSNEIVIKQGSAQMISIGAYNPTDETINNIIPTISCDDNTITSASTKAMTISPKNNSETTMLIKTTKKTSSDIHVCTISLNNLSSSTRSIDLVIRIV